MSQKIISEVESLLQGLKPVRTAHIHEKYIGGGASPYRFLNLGIPQVRQFARRKFSFSHTPDEWKSWDHVWQSSQIYDVLLAAIVWAGSQPIEDQWRHRKILWSWSKKANNWALSDSICSIYAHLFEAHPKEMLPTLEKWSRSKDPWQKRMSIVSMFYYSSQRQSHPPYKMVKEFILRQLHDDHYYVQKGVGWTLRESFNVYPKETFILLKKIAREIPPPAWTAATEKLKPEHKKILIDLRKKKSSNF